MTLYQRTVCIIVVTLLGLVAILYATSRWIMLSGVRDQELEVVQQQTRRVTEAIRLETDRLGRLTQNWADYETLAPIFTGNAEQVGSETFGPTMMTAMAVDVIIVLDDEGALRLGQVCTQGLTRRLTALPPSLADPAMLHRLAIGSNGWGRKRGGLLAAPDGLLLLSVRPIIPRGQHDGGTRGTLIMGEFLRSEVLAHWSVLANADVAIHPLDKPASAREQERALAKLAINLSRPAVVALSEQRMLAVAVLPDIFEQLAVVVRLETDREFYHQGRASLSYYVLSLLLAGLVFGLAFLILLDKQVLSRLARMSERVQEIGRSGDLSARLDVQGRDELAGLAQGLNSMLDELQKTHGALRDAHDVLEQRVEARTKELREAQQQVIEQERMRALGQMASGIAHDFNNALSTILGACELIQMQRNDRQEKNDDDALLDSIHTAAQDAANAVGRLREFYRYRDETEVLQNVNLSQIVAKVVAMTEPMWKDQAQARGRTITMVKNLQEVPLVAGNEAELREMLTNLIFNAVDALPKGGTITLATESAGDNVVVSVTDNGLGMSEETRRRCLEPFFTTKGEGTGLGLAMVHGTIRRHQGTIDIDSEPGRGTTMRISIPVLTSQQVTVNEDDAAVDPVPPCKILLVDDVPSVRGFIRAYLTADGHEVHEAKDGPEGLERFYSDTYDLVITDRGMPGMSGDQLATEILQAAPEVPIIMLTGFGQMMNSAGEQPAGVDLVVGKPVTVNKLRRAMRDVLEARAQGFRPKS